MTNDLFLSYLSCNLSPCEFTFMKYFVFITIYLLCHFRIYISTNKLYFLTFAVSISKFLCTYTAYNHAALRKSSLPTLLNKKSPTGCKEISTHFLTRNLAGLFLQNIKMNLSCYLTFFTLDFRQIAALLSIYVLNRLLVPILCKKYFAAVNSQNNC